MNTDRNNIHIIAFYLPQYHPFKENDEWWGKGFTEWTNVGKAKPLFRGHNQPRVPTELGYYDLRLPIVREQQAEMAREAGVTAFCYWHYWFGNGKRLIADIFDEVLSSGKPDFPFCLGWANHSWYAKSWNADGSASKKMLIEQTYPGVEDAKMHFDFLIKAFKDERYVKIDGKPLFYIFDPLTLPNEYLAWFRQWTRDAGFEGLYLVANVTIERLGDEILSKGYDAINYQRLAGGSISKFSNIKGSYTITKMLRKVKGFIVRRPPNLSDYSKEYPYLIREVDAAENVIPSIVPQWDHTPRSGWNGSLFVNATPESFYLHCKQALNVIKNKKKAILFLKSWNEWGEGNMMEPDITYGRGFIDSLKKALDDFNK